MKDSVYFGNRKKAKVFYTITASATYTINNLSYKIPDDLVKYFVLADTMNTLITKRSVYDVDILQKDAGGGCC